MRNPASSEARLYESIRRETRLAKKRSLLRRKQKREEVSGTGKDDLPKSPLRSPLPALGSFVSTSLSSTMPAFPTIAQETETGPEPVAKKRVPSARKRRRSSVVGVTTKSMVARAKAKEEETLQELGKPSSSATIKIEQLQAEICEIRETYNAVKHELAGRKEVLQEHQDRLKTLKFEDDVQRRRKEGLKIIEDKEKILKEIEFEKKRNIEYAETLRHIKGRLMNEQMLYDSTMEVGRHGAKAHLSQAYEEALRVRHMEGEETFQELRKARQVLEEEQLRLQDFEKWTEKERAKWEDELRDRHELLLRRDELIRWKEECRQKDMQLELELAGDMDESAEKRMKERHLLQLQRSQELAEIILTKKTVLLDLETALQKIKLATGVTDPREIITRYNNRFSHSERIDSHIEVLQAKLADLKLQQNFNQKVANDALAGGLRNARGVEFSREVVDELSNKGERGRRQLKTSTEELERLESLLLAIKQSIESVLSKVCEVDTGASSVDVGTTLADRLLFIEDKLGVIMRQINTKHNASEGDRRKSCVMDIQPAELLLRPSESSPVVPEVNTNVRVRPGSALRSRTPLRLEIPVPAVSGSSECLIIGGAKGHEGGVADGPSLLSAERGAKARKPPTGGEGENCGY